MLAGAGSNSTKIKLATGICILIKGRHPPRGGGGEQVTKLKNQGSPQVGEWEGSSTNSIMRGRLSKIGVRRRPRGVGGGRGALSRRVGEWEGISNIFKIRGSLRSASGRETQQT